MNIHLKGYFGYENLGDDLLMISSIRLIYQKYPEAHIYIRSKSNYINDLFPEVFLVDSFENLPVIDILIYGGGGVFFDFIDGGCKIKNSAVKVISLSIFNRLVKIIRPKSNLKILGWGLGIGPYNIGSKRFLNEMYHLSRFDFLGVRDKRLSYKIAKKVNSKNTYVYTDIVFQKKLWIDKYNINENLQTSSVCIIPRGWEFEKKELKELQLAKSLKEKGIEAKFLFFNPEKDKDCIELVKLTEFKSFLYQPRNANAFLSELKASKLIVTQRAHGAIVASTLGCPSICIGIEEKLKNVHSMIPESSLFCSLDYNINEMTSLIISELETEKLKVKVKKDLIKNQTIITRLEEKINELSIY
ncbi:polysaccharide pyruvyl transferase family protein [Wenyingzhuangia sp. IMCC45467]